MTGTEIDACIKKLLIKFPGIIGYHNPDSMRATVRGWPDWVFIGRRILYREIKGHGDDLSVHQRRVARAIMRANGDWEVWGPRDVLPGGRAEMQLSAIALWRAPQWKPGSRCRPRPMPRPSGSVITLTARPVA